MPPALNYYSTQWFGPGAAGGSRRRFRFFRIARTLIIPPKGQRTLPTLAGYVLIILTIGMTMAAYQANSNILFIAVSVLVGALVVSGVFSWINTNRVSWRLRAEPPFRAGERARVRIEVRNEKKVLPSYALVFHVEGSQASQVVALSGPLEAGELRTLDLDFFLRQRGSHRLQINAVSSVFPFGFLRKTMAGGSVIESVIWPERIAYRKLTLAGGGRQFTGEPLMKSGNGSEFINLRNYQHGDSHRDIHWKASARLRSLVVRQRAIEVEAGYVLHVRTSVALWETEVQFDRLCSFVSCLAEEFYEKGVLTGARIDDEPHLRISRKSEFNSFQDRLATLGRLNDTTVVPPLPGAAVVTFEPDFQGGIDAYIDGQRAATA